MINNTKLKANIALEALLGIIVSLIIFIIFINFLLSALGKPTNLSIADQNVDSIGNFLEHTSNDDYSGLKSCYSILKMENLENYQIIDKDSTVYFYVIDENGIYYIKSEYLDQFRQSGSLSGIKTTPDFNFEKKLGRKLDVVYDETDKNSVWVPYGFGSSDSIIKFDSRAEFILLEPTNNNQNEYKVSVYVSGRNKLDTGALGGQRADNLAVTGSTNFWHDIEGNYIVYDRENSQIFATSHKYSDFLVQEKLCSTKYLVKSLSYEKYENTNNPREIDHINNYIYLYWKNTNTNSIDSVSFEWLGGPICKENGANVDCSLYLRENYDKISYYEFCNRVENYYKNKQDGGEGVWSFDIKVEELSQSEIVASERLVFDEVFTKSDIDIKDKTLDDYLDELGRESFAFNLNFKVTIYGYDMYFNKKEFNGVKNDLSNTIFYENAKAWFYLDESFTGKPSGYYAFNEDFLRKIDDKTLFFNSKQIKIGEENIKILDDEKNYILKEDNKMFYFFNIDGIKKDCSTDCSLQIGKEYQIILSKIQYEQIFDLKLGD